ncbi:MAG: heparinase II/III family protein [Clostridia bacterium]|nr:heparinase II/III family protein [Clostridia bacterium]
MGKFLKKAISSISAISMLISLAVPVSYAENVNYSVEQDIGDFTYFNSNYINSNYRNYSLVTENLNSNEAEAGPFDYTNPDKTNEIRLSNKAGTNCSFTVDTTKRTGEFKNAKRYKYFKLSAEFKILKASTYIELFNIKGNSKTYRTSAFLGTDMKDNPGNVKKTNVTLNEWHKYYTLVNLETGAYEMYIDGALAFSKTYKDITDLSSVMILMGGLSQGEGEAYLRNIEVTGYEKAPADGAVQKTNVFVPDSESKGLLSGYVTAFHGYSNVYFKNGEKHNLAKDAINENGNLFVSLEDFNEALGINAGVDNDIISYNSISKKLEKVKHENGIIYIDPSEASEALGYKALNDKKGMVLVSNSEIRYNLNDEMPDWQDSNSNNFAYDDLYFSGYADTLSDLQLINWYLLYDRPTPEMLKDNFNSLTNNGQKHPRLLVNEEKINEINSLKNTDAYYNSLVSAVIASADNVINEDVVTYSFNNAGSDKSNEVAEKFETRVKKLAFAYLLTNDEAYAQRAMQDIMSVASFPDFNYQHIIDSGMWSSGLAYGYDWLYNYMTEQQRRVVSEAIVKLEIEPLNRAYYSGLPSNILAKDKFYGGGFNSGNVFPRWKSNYGAYANSGVIISALAAAEANPDLCFEALSNAMRAMEFVMWGFDTGEWLEGQRYWRTILSDLAYSIGAVESIYGDDFNMLSGVGRKEQMRNLISFQGAHCRFAYGDDSDSVTQFWSTEAYSYFASKMNQNDVAFMRRIKLDSNLRPKYGRMMSADAGPLDLLYYSRDASKEDLSNLPNVKVSKGNESFTVHENYSDPNAMFFAASGGPTTIYHQHNDGGNFVFECGGEEWAREVGTGDYSVGSLVSRYTGRTEAHNTLTISPDQYFSQKPNSFAEITANGIIEGGAYAVYNMTGLYDDARMLRRAFFITDEYKTLTVRDEMSFSTQKSGYWFMNTDAEAIVENQRLVRLEKNGKTLYVQIDVDGASSSDVSIMDSVPMPSSPKVSGDLYPENVKKIAVEFTGSDVNITVRMSQTIGEIDTRRIDEKIDSVREKVWSQNFEDCNTFEDCANEWDYNASNRAAYPANADIESIGGNNVLAMRISDSLNGASTSGADYILSTKDVSNYGIQDSDDYSLSYRVKMDPLSETDNKGVQYFLGLSTSKNQGKAAYIYSQVKNRVSIPYVHNDAKVTAPVSNVKLYPGAWNDIEWVVHRSQAAKESTADLYINGSYSCTVKNRNDDFMNKAVFNIGIAAGDKEAKLLIDDIALYKGGYQKQDFANNACVSVIDTDFSDMIAEENGSADISKMPYYQGINAAGANDSQYVTVETVTGNKGKGADDKAVYWHNNTGLSGAPSSYDSYMKFATDYSGKLIKAGDSTEFAIDFAYDEVAAPLGITARLFDENYSAHKILNFIKVSPDRISLLGDKYVFTNTPALIPGNWYRLRAVITAGDGISTYNTISIYINGIAAKDSAEGTVIEDFPLEAYREKVNSGGTNDYMQFMGFSELWLQVNYKGWNVSKGIYYDNLKLKNYLNGAKAKRSIDSVDILISSPEKSAQRGTVYACGSDTVKDVISNFNMSDVKQYVVRDASGNEAAETESAIGKYIELKSQNNNLYYVHIAENSQLKAISDASSADMTVDSNLEKQGVNVRGNNNESIKLSKTGTAPSGSAQIKLFDETTTFGSYSTYQPVITNISVMPVRADSKFELRYYSFADTLHCQTSGTPYKRGLTGVYFDTDGKIYGKNSEYPIMDYEPNKWYKVTMIFYPGTSTFKIYINDEYASGDEYTLFRYPIQFVNRVDLVSYDEVIVDDIDIYTGKYFAGESPEVTSSSEDAFVSGNQIYLPSGLITSDLVDYLSFDGTVSGVYTDAAKTQKTSSVLDGGVLEISKSGITADYTFVVCEENEVYLSKSGNNVNAYVLCYEEGAKLILAKYAGGKLVKANIIDRADMSSFIFGNETTDQNETITAFIMDLSTLKPYGNKRSM